MHSLNSIVVSHFKNSWTDADSMFAMTKIVHISSYWDQLVQSTLAAAFSEPPVWNRGGGGSKAVCDDARLIVD